MDRVMATSSSGFLCGLEMDTFLDFKFFQFKNDFKLIFKIQNRMNDDNGGDWGEVR
jgi:hypothetical protein